MDQLDNTVIVYDFAMRGSMLDMAVGIIVGAAFGRVVSSFVSDILMPPIGLFAGHSDFSNKFINLSGHAYATLAEAKAAGAATINYGVFFNALSDFLIVAFVVFMLIRQVNRQKSEQEASVAVMRDCKRWQQVDSRGDKSNNELERQ